MTMGSRTARTRAFTAPLSRSTATTESEPCSATRRRRLAGQSAMPTGSGPTSSRRTTLNAAASAGLLPDLTILLDVAPEEGFRRLRGRGLVPDRIESESLEFHRRVREGYLRLRDRHPDRIVAVDGSLSADEVFRRVRETASDRFGW